MKPNITEFDPAAYLDHEALIAEYLSQVMSDGDSDEMLAALGHVAKARGMTPMANDSGLGPESL